MKGYIDYNSAKPRYFDKDGNELHEGDNMVQSGDYLDTSYRGRIDRIGSNEEGYLGTDATNRKQIEAGLRSPFECGIYLFNEDDMNYITLVQ